MKRRRRLLIQGATGSIGASTLDIIRRHHEHFEVAGLAARSNGTALAELAREFRSASVAVVDEQAAQTLKRSSAVGRNFYDGSDALERQAEELEYDLLVNAVMGGAGLDPTVAALRRGIDVALANKETLVAAGPLVMRLAAESGARVLPIDSEHSAIFQCLAGESPHSVRRVWLTTSGGPFWNRSVDELPRISVEEALAHPTWKMGPKITIDSATLFNKGLEVIEAQRLFGVSSYQIEVVGHRQSVVHSMVEFVDGSFKAQLSAPDMRLPILFALTYPDRIESSVVQTGVEQLKMLTFEAVPKEKFPCLGIAFRALEKGGTAPAAISAADEVAVAAFLERRIGYADIAGVISHVLDSWPDESLTDLETVRSADRRARELARKEVEMRSSKWRTRACC